LLGAFFDQDLMTSSDCC